MSRPASIAAVSGLVLVLAVVAVPFLRSPEGRVEVQQLPAEATPATRNVVPKVEVTQLATPVVEVTELPATAPLPRTKS